MADRGGGREREGGGGETEGERESCSALRSGRGAANDRFTLSSFAVNIVQSEMVVNAVSFRPEG